MSNITTDRLEDIETCLSKPMPIMSRFLFDAAKELVEEVKRLKEAYERGDGKAYLLRDGQYLWVNVNQFKTQEKA